MARGVAAPVATGAYTASAGAGAAYGAAGDGASYAGASSFADEGMAYSSMRAKPMAGRAPSMAFVKDARSVPPSAARASYGGSLSRAESNLDDIVLGATKAAAKKAGIDYKN